MDRLARIATRLGIAVLVVAIVLIVGNLVQDEVIPIVVAVASGLLFFAIFRTYLTRTGEVYKDERTQKIQNSALAISWWVAYVVLAIAFLLSVSDVLRMSLEDFIPLMFFTMLITYWVSKLYLSRRRL